MDPALTRFLEALDLDPAPVRLLMEQAIADLDWEDPLGQIDALKPGELLFCSTFGETVAESVSVQIGPYELRYPAPTQHRAATLHLVDASQGVQASLDDLVGVLSALDEQVGRTIALTAARALQPDAQFRWTDDGLAQAYEVVDVVERWPGQIQLDAARRHDPELALGDILWLEGREQVPVVWVLDWLRG